MNRIFYVALLGLLIAFSQPVSASVTFNMNGQLYEFNQSVRLATVLSVINDKPGYWANAAVYQLDDPQIEAERAQLLDELADLIRDYDKGSDGYKQLSTLYQQIGSWQLMRRLNINVDYDKARISNKDNPQFNEGLYYIKLQPRNTDIYVTGMVRKPFNTTLVSRLTVADYIDMAPVSEQADRSFVYVLEPNGHVSKVGIAYWNNDFYRPMPGSEIFVPLQDELFFNRINQLNERIAHLMINRM